MPETTAQKLVKLQHDLIMSFDPSEGPEDILENFVMSAINALNLNCIYFLQKDSPSLGLEAEIQRRPLSTEKFSQVAQLLKFNKLEKQDSTDFIEEVSHEDKHWYCYSLKQVGYIIFECQGSVLDASIIEGLTVPLARFRLAYVSRKQFILNEKRRQQVNSTSIRIQSEKYRLEHIFRSIKDGVLVLDNNGLVYFANLAAYKLFGIDENNPLEEHFTNYFRIIETDTKIDLTRSIVECCDENGAWMSNDPVILKTWEDKEIIVKLNVKGMRNNQGLNTVGEQYYVSTFHDISETYEMEQKLKWQATHDSLTQCLNRRGFEDQLHGLLKRTDRKSNHALICMDLDRFKHVNDIAGHSAGDALLQQVTVLMQQELRESDYLARVGGDEYCIILINVTKAILMDVAERIRKQIDRLRFKWEENIFTIGISLGVSVISPKEQDADAIFLRTDEACMASKENGRNQVTLAVLPAIEGNVHNNQDSTQPHMNYHNCVNKSLSDADNAYQIVLYHQDITSLSDPKLPDHQEVLIRIKHENRLIMPNAFLPAAERCGRVSEIDYLVFANTLEFLASHDGACLNVNISGITLSDDSSRNKIFDLICKYPREAQQLCIEITETAAITNLTKCISFIDKASSLGVTFALDDFGTGVSSFHYLKSLPVKYLKIDGSFIEDICNNRIDEIVVESIIAAASELNIRTVAEYVSNENILNRVRDLGIDYAQGFCLSEPQKLTTTKHFSEIRQAKLTEPA